MRAGAGQSGRRPGAAEEAQTGTRSVWPGTRHVDHTDLKLTESRLPKTRSKGIQRLTRQEFNFASLMDKATRNLCG